LNRLYSRKEFAVLKREKLKETDVILGMAVTGLSTVGYIMILFSDLHKFGQTKTGLSPGWFPELCFLILIILGSILLISSFVRKSNQDKTEKSAKLERTQILQVGLFMLMTIAYIFLIDILGYYISSFIVMTTFMFVLRAKGLHKILLVSLVLMVTIFLFFEKALNIFLPRGYLF